MTVRQTKAHVFIGSSTEGKWLADSLERRLRKYFQTKVWTQGVFELTDFALQSLVKASKDCGFAILLLTPDDKVKTRGKSRPAGRDNVVFEIGFFMGSLGPTHTFVVKEEDLKLPTDLDGVTVATYRSTNRRASVNRSALLIRERIIRVQAAEDSGPFGEAVLNWMNLSKRAREKLGQSKFIKIGGTRNALMQLVESAKPNYSILAICGYKGDYSQDYYQRNFQRCRAVKRVFSYEAIRNEIETKTACFALKGLEMHLDKKVTGHRDVQAFLIPRGILVRDLGGRNFDPPFSFGLAILLDGANAPKKAVVHWEMEAEPLKHLLAIEGVIIDKGQKELLDELVNLHQSIVGSDSVLSSKKNPKTIAAACRQLEKFWESHSSAGEKGKK